MTISPDRPLTLTRWLISDTAEVRYDVPDQPMSGEMDPFFFLTKTKNFIPHEYPCRTAFAAAHRDQRPSGPATAEPTRAHLPFGAEVLNLSGFWFRPTHIATHARTKIASEGGPVRFRLTTPGGAILLLNGAEVGWLAPYTRNLDAVAEFAAELPAGTSTIDVIFDDLAERDTRHAVRLDVFGDQAVSPVDPFHAETQAVSAVEATLASMHFPAPYFRGGEVALRLPAPLPQDGTAAITVEGDFMSHDRLTLTRAVPAGSDTLVIAPASELPADFRHFAVALTMGGFTAHRKIGVEVAHTAPPAPATQRERIAEALSAVAQKGEADTVTALARLAISKGEVEPLIEVALGPINECWDCADFALVPLLWARTVYADKLSPALIERIDSTILSYRYWMDEPGNDVQWYFSENHALLFHTAATLAGTLLPDAIFVRSGRTGRQQAEVGLERVRAWLDHFERAEMAEFNSAPYFPIDLKGLTALYALAPDADVRARAANAIARLLEIVANSSHHGVLTGAQGRSYEHTLRAAPTLELSAIARMLWGKGTFGSRYHALPQLALALRDHALPLPDYTGRALFEEDGEQEWAFRQGDNGFAALFHAKSREWALGTAAAYRWFEWGYQETLIHARIGRAPHAQVFINHPGERIHSGYGRPSYWGGSGSIPRVQQYRGLAIVIFRTSPEHVDFTHAYFPSAVFEDVLHEDRFAAGASGNGRIMVAASGHLQRMEIGPTTGLELRLPGHEAYWIVRVDGESSGGAPLADFAARFGGLRAEGDAEGTITVDDPSYGLVRFHPDGRVEAERRTLDPKTWTVRGERRVNKAPSLV